MHFDDMLFKLPLQRNSWRITSLLLQNLPQYLLSSPSQLQQQKGLVAHPMRCREDLLTCIAHAQ